MTKLTRLIALVSVVLLLGGSAFALAINDEIRDRIKPEGSVKVSGESAAAEEEASDRPGDEVYSAACASCHDSGAAGAPRTGRSGDWSDRMEQDMDTLYDHAINGIGAMPAKGGCSGCSEEEVRKATDYMVDQL